MSQTILIEPHDDLRKIFSLNLSTFAGTDVIIRNNSDDTLALLKILPQISLIITRVKVDEDDTAKKIHQFLKTQNLNIPLLVLGKSTSLPSEVQCLEEPIEWETVIKLAANSLGINLQTIFNKVKPEYLPVGIHYFYAIQNTPCDIFIRIKKGQNEYQYVKRINSKDTFDKNDIDKYVEQGLKEFYVPQDHIQYFTNFVTSQLIARLEDSTLSLDQRILVTASSHEVIRESVQLLGLDNSLAELSEASIDSMVKSVRNSPEIANLLKFLFSNKVSYPYQHCHLLALMCHYILSKQSWYRDDHLETLSFVSFFADVTLKTPQAMRISSQKELDSSSLSDEEKLLIQTHARDAAELLKSHPESNNYIKTVLLQSHGTLNGVGFETIPSEELHPLSKIFIVADTFIKILLNPLMPSAKKDILPLLYARFSGPSYQKIIKALEQKFD